MLMPRRTGFTIIEVMVVVVVIAILATIALVGYDSVRTQADDTKRASDIATFREAMQLWSTINKTAPHLSGTGYGGGTGWTWSNAYPLSIETLLINSKLIAEPMRDPLANTNSQYMFYRCNTTTYGNTYAFFAKLSDPTKQSGNQLSRWLSLGCTTTPSSSHGMNYALMFEQNL